MKYYTVHFNRPDFLALQKEFIKGELIVINNHCNPAIEEECKRLDLRYYNVTNPYGAGSPSHAHALNYLKTIIDYTDDYCLLDHDFFPYVEIDLSDYDVVGHRCDNVPGKPYLWPGFFAAKKEIRLDDINFMPGVVPNGDTGCDTYRLLQIPGLKVKFCREVYVGEQKTDYIQTSPIVGHYEGYGIHYLNGSNWMPAEDGTQEDKLNLVRQLLKDLAQ